MKRIILLFVLILLAVTTTRASELRGVWTAHSDSADSVDMRLSREHNQHEETMQLSAFAGLTDAQIGSLSEVPVHFHLEREAGNVAFEGSFKMRDGVGHFVFTPNTSYLAALRGLGVSTEDLDSGTRGTDETLFELALLDVSTNYIRSMQAEGYHETARKYMEMRIFHVTPELVRDLRGLGYRDIPAQKLIEMQIHRASPQFIRDLAAVGYHDIAISELVNFRIHRVTPEAIREYRALGYDHPSPDELVTMAIHRVTPEFIRQLKDAGYPGVPIGELVNFRIHQVTPDSVRDYRSLGYDHLTPEQLVTMSIHRVTPEFIREMKDAGYTNVPVEKLVALRIHGIDGIYVKKMQGVK